MSSSRRESRSSLGNRQNDALFEFENFKKKFLLANKHITKLNSTLSVRIEELNGQISMLYVENLRLRASEIALASQLKREREQSRKVLTDAEAASQALTKHLCYLRESIHPGQDYAAPPTPPSPRARRPVVNADTDPTSPQFRIARPPNVPGIYEDEEPGASSAEETQKHATPPRKKTKTKPRLSASKLPLPLRGPSPTPSSNAALDSQHIDLSTVATSSKSRKSVRRQSGLLTVNMESLSVPRSGSPAFGSPIRLEAALAEEEEERAAEQGNIVVDVVEQRNVIEVVKKEKRKGKSKEQRDSESEKEAPRELKRSRDAEDSSDVPVKPKSSSRNALQPIDRNEEPADSDAKQASQRQFLRPPSPPMRDSSSPAPGDQADGQGGREKRVRKSVNYTEPKLNTKMRKPDPPEGSEPARKKRSSAAAIMSSTAFKPPSSSSNTAEATSDTDARSSLELVTPQVHPTLPLRGTNGYINPDNFPLPSSRPGSAAAMYSPGPPSRTTGSTTSSSSTTTTTSSSLSSNATATTTVKRKKSRPQLPLSDDESDGAEADAEYLGGGHASGGSSGPAAWANVDSSRRRGPPKRSAATAAVAALEDIRRHSMVI